MKKNLFLLILLTAIPFWSSAQPTDQKNTEKKEIKTGWNMGALPAISFDSDLGFQYGAVVNFFNYGDGSNYPDYNHSLYFEVSRYTKGSGTYRFYYDSEALIPGIEITTDLSYLPDQAYDFFGFNGYEAVYNKNWIDDTSPDYRTRMFYKFHQKLFRFKTDIQGDWGDSNFRWLAGFNLLSFNISSVDVDKLNKGKKESDKLPPVSEQPGLYEKYQQWGIISAKEANGGFVPIVKAGLVYDTRDNKPNPMHGIWAEAELATAQKFMGAESSFAKLSITQRQYFTLIKNDLSFAYRVQWQQTIGGHAPFYYQPQIIASALRGSSSSGLGGAKTLRGILRNRIVGDGFVMGNTEMRWKFARIEKWNQHFYCGLNGFLDFGRVVKKMDIRDKISNMNEPMNQYFNFGAEKMHYSVGGGLRLAMNQNFIAALDYGIALDKQDGDTGIYIGLNYLF